MSITDSAEIQCPYCWERIFIEIDPSVPMQEYIEDCQVCCRPMEIRVNLDADGRADVSANREDD